MTLSYDEYCRDVMAINAQFDRFDEYQAYRLKQSAILSGDEDDQALSPSAEIKNTVLKPQPLPPSP